MREQKCFREKVRIDSRAFDFEIVLVVSYGLDYCRSLEEMLVVQLLNSIDYIEVRDNQQNKNLLGESFDILPIGRVVEFDSNW